MNERIKELLVEADIKFDRDINEIEVCVMLPSDLEKFAELIVRECLVQISNAIPDTDCSASGAYKTAKIAATIRVKEHFAS